MPFHWQTRIRSIDPARPLRLPISEKLNDIRYCLRLAVSFRQSISSMNLLVRYVREADVVIALSRFGHKYLKTVADDEESHMIMELEPALD